MNTVNSTSFNPYQAGIAGKKHFLPFNISVRYIMVCVYYKIRGKRAMRMDVEEGRRETKGGWTV